MWLLNWFRKKRPQRVEDSRSWEEEIDRLNREVVRLYQRGDFRSAMVQSTRAAELARRHLGEDHPDFATSLNDLAELYRAMGDYARAEPLYRQALEIYRVALGENHPHFATSLNNLAGLYAGTERTSEAFAMMVQAAKIDDRMMGQVFA